MDRRGRNQCLLGERDRVFVRIESRTFLSNFSNILHKAEVKLTALVGRVLRVPLFKNRADDCLAPILEDLSILGECVI